MMKELTRRGYRVLGIDKSSVDDAKRFFARSDDRFDLVVHCAYEVGGRAHIDGVNTALIENVLLDSSMFNWALKTKQKRVLYYSSSAAYPVALQKEDAINPITGKPGWLYLYETLIDNALLGNTIGLPDSHYGWAKLTGERLAKVAGENGLRVHVVRPFSGYGETQSLDYPFPSIIRRALADDLSLWGPPGQTRDWIHVEDVIAGSLAVVDADQRLPVNICTGEGTEMGHLMLMANRMAYPDRDLNYSVSYDKSKPTGVFHRVGDPSRFNEIYTPKITIEEGVSRAIEKLRG